MHGSECVGRRCFQSRSAVGSAFAHHLEHVAWSQVKLLVALYLISRILSMLRYGVSKVGLLCRIC